MKQSSHFAHKISTTTTELAEILNLTLRFAAASTNNIYQLEGDNGFKKSHRKLNKISQLIQLFSTENLALQISQKTVFLFIHQLTALAIKHDDVYREFFNQS